jgi:hypothetical protein
VGLGALSPNDPNTIFISTRYDPRAVQPGVTDTNQPYSAWHEIWKGVTTNHGAAFTWTPITQNSSHDNLRPIVPPWDANNTALIWFRATYSTAQIIDGAPVGLVERRAEALATMTYVDATTNNTTLATGGALVPSDSANQWHQRTNSGNGGALFASADASAENAPILKTSVALPAPGTYDVWVNFWGNPNADWRVVAGLSTNNLQLFREMACKEVEPGEHNTTLVLSNSSAFLYQAYVGRITGASVDVFIDDNDIQTGTTGTAAGDTVRTWYDGVSYAAVTPVQINLNITYDRNASSATLSWNSIAPLLTSPATVTYTVQKKNLLTDPDWITLATGLPTAGSMTSYIDNSAGGGAGFYRVTSP